MKKCDIMKCASVKIERKNDQNIKPVNCRTPIPVQLHLRKAADQELKDFIKAGIIEKCHHFTPWLSHGMFISKKKDKESDEVKVRLVADFSPVNRVLQTPNYPNEGSSAHLKMINPKSKAFATLDFSSGYYQIPIPEKDRDLFAFLLPQGKFRFTRLPKGTKPAGDIFDIISDKELWDLKEAQKKHG